MFRPKELLLLLLVGLPRHAPLPRRGGGGEAVRFGGEGERRVREENRLLVGDNEGRDRVRDFNEETSTGLE